MAHYLIGGVSTLHASKIKDISDLIDVDKYGFYKYKNHIKLYLEDKYAKGEPFYLIPSLTKLNCSNNLVKIFNKKVKSGTDEYNIVIYVYNIDRNFIDNFYKTYLTCIYKTIEILQSKLNDEKVINLYHVVENAYKFFIHHIVNNRKYQSIILDYTDMNAFSMDEDYKLRSVKEEFCNQPGHIENLILKLIKDCQEKYDTIENFEKNTNILFKFLSGQSKL